METTVLCSKCKDGVLSNGKPCMTCGNLRHMPDLDAPLFEDRGSDGGQTEKLSGYRFVFSTLFLASVFNWTLAFYWRMRYRLLLLWRKMTAPFRLSIAKIKKFGAGNFLRYLRRKHFGSAPLREVKWEGVLRDLKTGAALADLTPKVPPHPGLVSCQNPECDGDGILRDGPWGTNAPCPDCVERKTGKRLKKMTAEELAAFKKKVDDFLARDAQQVAQAAVLKVEKVDTSTWTEFPSGFFDKPASKSSIYFWTENDTRYCAPLAMFAATCATREKAVEVLRDDLRKLAAYPDAEVFAYLSPPSTMEVLVEPKKGETPDTESWVDLSGPRPMKKGHVAFCFLHGKLNNPLRALAGEELVPIVGYTLQEGSVGARRD